MLDQFPLSPGRPFAHPPLPLLQLLATTLCLLTTPHPPTNPASPPSTCAAACRQLTTDSHNPDCPSFPPPPCSGNVIVHCAGGVSRSATVVIGYLMARHDDALSFDQALSRVREVRPFVRPNPGFEAQLREWERLGRDMGKWAAWRRVWQERERSSASSSSGRLPVEGEQVAGGEGGGRGYGQCVIAIPPPVDARCCGGSAPAGQLPAELLVLAQLNVDGEAVMN